MFPGKKKLLSESLSTLGISDALAGLVPGRGLMMLAYHRVLDIGPEDGYPADPELISATPADFEAQMRFVGRHFNVIRFADVIDAMDRGAPLPPRSLLITFDDGHSDNYDHAFPILRSLGLPATIFISTDYIGSDRMFWFDRQAYLLYCAHAGRHRVSTLGLDLVLGDIASRRAASDMLVEALKQVADETRHEALAELESVLPPRDGAPPAPARPTMTWAQVQEMSNAGIDFASHAVTHPVLTRLDDASLERELRYSRDIISSRTGRDVPVIAYPVGKVGAFDERVARVARQCGYRLGVSYESGTNPSIGFDTFALRRLAVERYTTLGMFKAMLTLPQLFS